MTRKHIIDLRVSKVERVSSKHALIRLTSDAPLPEMNPGQFAEVRADGAQGVFLRRPISINNVDRDSNELWLLVAMVGEATRALGRLKEGGTLNCVLPLGNGFTMPSSPEERVLLVGGGVGVAPLLYMGAKMKEMGCTPTFLLGAKTEAELLMLEEYEKVGRVLVTTEDGTAGEKGFVTNHTVFSQEKFDRIACCGPKPMMQAVARLAQEKGTDCEVSLENKMACGVGACLCCVEDTKAGNVCVCKEGPVFNVKKLLWHD